jgi:hypothetical protein
MNDSHALIGGSALMIEDLDVTMTSVTYTCPQWYGRRAAECLFRQLKEREIRHTLEWKFECNPPFLSWDVRLKLESGREFLFMLYEEGYGDYNYDDLLK